jgi:hypothetical protein
LVRGTIQRPIDKALISCSRIFTSPQVRSDHFPLVENRAFMGAFSRGRDCTRDKWRGHVAPEPFGASWAFCRAFCRGPYHNPRQKGSELWGLLPAPLLSRVIILPATKGPCLYIHTASFPPPPPYIFFLGGERWRCMLAHFFFMCTRGV